MFRAHPMPLSLIAAALLIAPALSAEEPVLQPSINAPFRNPDVQEFVGKFEVESREVYSRRKEIVAACEIKPGQKVADIGAGTGLFTRLFAAAVGKEGRVVAVDIDQKYLDHIARTSREANLANVDTLLGKPDSTELPADSIDLVFICDTYHHFEYPQATLASIHRALRPGGELVILDFVREVGVSRDWILEHVRAGEAVVTQEVAAAGFTLVRREATPFLRENYVLRFRRS